MAVWGSGISAYGISPILAPPLNNDAPSFVIKQSLDVGHSAAVVVETTVPSTVQSSGFTRVTALASSVSPGSSESLFRLWVVGTVCFRPRWQQRCTLLWCFCASLDNIEALSSLAYDLVTTTSSPRCLAVMTSCSCYTTRFVGIWHRGS